MSRLRIKHTTAFTYRGPVTASYNQARMIPLTEPGQQVLQSSLDVSPLSWRHDFTDYWGTSVAAFEVTHPHRRLVVTARSTVELDSAPSASEGERVGWDELRGRTTRDRFGEFLAVTPTTSVPPAVVDLARATLAGRDPHDAAEAICRAVREELEYVPGVTAVHTPATEAWEARKGVCQDMAHLTLGALRAVGIPARYISGYLYPRSGGELGQTVVGESHAWVEWWVGSWTAFDPTNRTYVGDRHVVLARGREYNDVPPLRGIYAGTAAENLEVKVQITREA